MPLRIAGVSATSRSAAAAGATGVPPGLASDGSGLLRGATTSIAAAMASATATPAAHVAPGGAATRKQTPRLRQ